MTGRRGDKQRGRQGQLVRLVFILPLSPSPALSLSVRKIKQPLPRDWFEQSDLVANDDVVIAGQQRQLGERTFGAGEHRLQAAEARFEFVLRDSGLQQFGQTSHAGDFLKVEVRQPKNFLDRLDQPDPFPMPDQADGDFE